MSVFLRAQKKMKVSFFKEKLKSISAFSKFGTFSYMNFFFSKMKNMFIFFTNNPIFQTRTHTHMQNNNESHFLNAVKSLSSKLAFYQKNKFL